jgi:outer membrane biosynthesis protein TonB
LVQLVFGIEQVSKGFERTNSVIKRILNTYTSALLLTMLATVCASTSQAKKPEHFVPPSVSKAGDIPYPANSLDAGVVTLSVHIEKTGQVLGVTILRDIPSVSGPAEAAVRSWTYIPAMLDGKPVPSTLTINIEYDPGFLGADNIPLPPPAQVQPISTKDPGFLPPQLNTANFAPYPAKAKTQGAVVLNVQLDTNGNVANVATLRDIQPLTASATGVLKNWNFSAATYKGNPIQSHMIVAFVFRSPSAPLP